jgi:hypothetical protein
MSNSKDNTEQLSNKQKHNRESIATTVKREYDVFTKGDLEEPTEEIQRSELNESSVRVEHAGIPKDDELETIGKPYGTLGSVGKDRAYSEFSTQSLPLKLRDFWTA